MQAVNLAKALDVERVSVVEFGVAGGNGLLALEKIAEQLEAIYGIAVDVHGFDTGGGLPAPVDYRDLPNIYSGRIIPPNLEAIWEMSVYMSEG